LKEASKTLEEIGYNIYTIDELGIYGKVLNYWEAEKIILNKEIDLIITDGYLIDKDYKIRRNAVDLNIPIILNGKLGKEISLAIKEKKNTYYENKEYGVDIWSDSIL
ncbi:MAG: hypothetical protein C0172_03630, partial [Caldisphaera sp.]